MLDERRQVLEVVNKANSDKPYTHRPAETRMGKGKGNVEYWVAVVKPGRIMFEVGGLPEEAALEALRQATYKFSIKTKVVAKYALGSGESES